jgi:hypothetical protein
LFCAETGGRTGFKLVFSIINVLFGGVVPSRSCLLLLSVFEFDVAVGVVAVTAAAAGVVAGCE